MGPLDMGENDEGKEFPGEFPDRRRIFPSPVCAMDLPEPLFCLPTLWLARIVVMDGPLGIGMPVKI